MTTWRGTIGDSERVLPEEIPVALTYDRVTVAVMMASPVDLYEFAVGFSISEGIIRGLEDITDFELVLLPLGIECRISLVVSRQEALIRRRRHIAGPAGCGLCGMDSLAEAVRPIDRIVSEFALAPETIAWAIAQLPTLQTLNRETRGVHAAALFDPAGGEFMIYEDVGRHNALDKLIGATRLAGRDASSAVVILTSRISIELIQKTARMGCAVLVAVSVPTARAVREAEAAGITLIAVARDDGFEIFTHAERVKVVYAPCRSDG
jgi:FdhD protein